MLGNDCTVAVAYDSLALATVQLFNCWGLDSLNRLG